MKKSKLKELNSLLGELDVVFVDPAAEAEEVERLVAFEKSGGLDGPAYALSSGMAEFDLTGLVQEYGALKDDIDRLKDPARNDTGYTVDNGYYDTPDAEALYLMVRRFKPERVIEVGCGNSTRITRAAVIDGGLDTMLTAIDPYPRADIAHVVDHFEQKRLEEVDPALFDRLKSGDILFIDSSHQVRMSNDVAHLFCRIIPGLAAGVVIHVHDVFLPYEYPKRFFYDCPSWGEQYILHALLQGGGYDIEWPGYYLQKERPDAVKALPFLEQGRAQSFWIRKR